MRKLGQLFVCFSKLSRRTDEFFGFGAAVTAAEGEIIEGFKQVGLAFTISPQDKVDPGRKSETGRFQVAESID